MSSRRLRKYKIEKEWQLQRISLQCAVLYVASTYCTFVTVFTNTRDDLFSWLLGVIIVAQVWSCVVAFGMLFKALKLGHKCYKVVKIARDFRKARVHAISSPWTDCMPEINTLDDKVTLQRVTTSLKVCSWQEWISHNLLSQLQKKWKDGRTLLGKQHVLFSLSVEENFILELMDPQNWAGALKSSNLFHGIVATSQSYSILHSRKSLFTTLWCM